MPNNRRRGHSFEREIAIKLRELFPEARRKLEYQLQDCNGVDLQDTGKLRIQCKRAKTSVPMNKLYEIQDQSGIGILISKVDREQELVTMKLSDFLSIVDPSKVL